jgi:hypothetical protein
MPARRINLKVEPGVRTATGKNRRRWSQLGHCRSERQDAVIGLSTGTPAAGAINVDQILFSDVPPDRVEAGTAETVAKPLPWRRRPPSRTCGRAKVR